MQNKCKATPTIMSELIKARFAVAARHWKLCWMKKGFGGE
ncbi:hypothetical protein O59_004016 [Cellvibrio sp. BR]|nr:hypothetical protein O59_004016 [Cellvibrio sp. BR]